ncbi:MAG: TetR/AcrR family transcriptional regulator [Pseudomonadota bacterium]
MTSEYSKDPARKPRADAARNRQRLLDTARVVFREKGAQASLEEIAREAGVGIGTLYRHFPSRDALVEQVYRAESRALADAASALAATHAPAEALRLWMRVFVGYVATKQIMAAALSALVRKPELYAESGAQMKAAARMLFDRAVASGEIHPGVEPMDLLRAVAGVVQVAPETEWEASAYRVIDLLVAGLRQPSVES